MASLPRFDNTLGALFIGFSLSTVLYGLFLVQVYNYYHRYPSDKAGYKAIVALLLLLETAHQAFIGHTVYWYSITRVPVVEDWKPVWSLVFQILVEAVLAAVVKFVFILRVWRFSYGNPWVTGILLLLDFGQLCVAIYYTVKSQQLPTLLDLAGLRVVGSIALGIGVLNDAGIAVALYYYLQKMRTGHTRTNHLIRNLTLYAVNTGVLTSAMSFATLLIYNFMPRNFIFAGCYFVLSKLYGVSFIATLNTRQIIRGRSSDVEPIKFTLERVTDRPSPSSGVPLQTDMVERDSTKVGSDRDGEDAPRFNDLTGERSSYPVHLPAHTNVHLTSPQAQRPYYSVGW